MAGMNRADERKENPPAPPPKGSGNWSKMARESMEKSLLETREALGLARETLASGIKQGLIPIEIPEGQIIDEVGTDRILEADDAEDGADSFASLLENIRTRGLRVPLRVRPTDPEWEIDPANPRDIEGQTFAVQSGRRRLAACRQLGIAPTAFLTFPKGDLNTADLEERFFENAARKNLSLIEKLYSIGLIASNMEDMSQAKIAEIIGVNAPYVSRGLAVVEYFDRLKEDLDLKSASAREIDEALKGYRGEAPKSDLPSTERSRAQRARNASDENLPFRKQVIGKTHLSLKNNTKGERVLSLRGQDLNDETIQKILDLIKQDSNGAGG